MVDADVGVDREQQREDVVMDQVKQELKKANSISSFNLVLGPSQSDTQSPIPTSTSVPDRNIVGEKDNDKDDDDSAPLRFPLRQIFLENCDLSIKEPPENKSKVGEKPAHKKGEVRKTTIKFQKSGT